MPAVLAQPVELWSMAQYFGSKRAKTILSHVEELAQRYQSEVVFVQVVEGNPSLVGQVTEATGTGVLERRAIHYPEIRCDENEPVRTWALYPRGGYHAHQYVCSGRTGQLPGVPAHGCGVCLITKPEPSADTRRERA